MDETSVGTGGLVPPPPEKLVGLDSVRAWKVAVVAAVTNGVAFGTIYTFGTFFEAMADEFDSGLGPTSLVFGITLFLFFGAGAGSGFLADRYGPRPLVWVGGLMFSGGLFLTSRVDVLWHGYLTYGLGAGLGGGLFIAPLFAAVAGWFDRYRAIAQGVAATGNGLGTLILVPLANHLIERNGWRQTYVVLAVVCAVTFGLGGLLVERPPVGRPLRAGRHLRAVMATASFRRLAIGSAMASACQSSAFVFTVLFATDAGISSARAALLVGLIGASSIVGRLFLTGLSGRVGPVRMLQACFFGQPVAFAVLLVAGANYALLVTYAILLGVAYGGYVALMGEVSAHLFGVRGLAVVLGWVYLAAAVGSLTFPVLVAYLADATTTNTVPIAAVVAVAAAGSVFLLRLRPDPIAAAELERN
ncbi:MAG: MFS transporter [Acidimicrobiales bacterium]